MTKEELIKELELLADSCDSNYALEVNGYRDGVLDALNLVNKYFDLAHVSGSLPDFEYEMFFKSEPDDFCKIDGWYPIATDRIKNQEKIEKYIESGLLRKIR